LGAMRSKRKRLRLNPVPCLWALLVLNVVVGFCFSSITSVVRVRTQGVPPFDQGRTQEILNKLRGTPCVRVDARSIETDVMSSQAVYRAEFSRNIFGNGLLTVEYRTPAAKLADSESVALSSDGVLYKSEVDLPENLPTLQLPGGPPTTVDALAGNWPSAGIGELAVDVQRRFKGQDLKIEVDRRGVVCLNIGSGRVVLGSCNDLSLKLKTLEDRLQKNPRELDQVEELNLTSPLSPAIVPKSVGKRREPVRQTN